MTSSIPTTRPRAITIGALCLATAALIALTSTLDPRIGQSEFRYTWTAARLLLNRQNMYDTDLVLALQQREIGEVPFPLVSYSPPWAVLVVAPYALLPFRFATRLWLLTNVFLLIVAALMLWPQSPRRSLPVALATTFAFSIALTALVIGQSSIFVYAMVALFVTCETRGKGFVAGVALAGMAAKPQLVFMVMLFAGLYALHQRRYSIMAGFGVTALLAAGIVSVLRPTWLPEYQAGLAQFNPMEWESANLSGLFLALTGIPQAKLLGLAVILLGVWGWWQYRARLSFRVGVDAGVLLSLICSPFVFSYDLVALLAPLLTITALIARGTLPSREKRIVVAGLIAADVLSFVERVLSPSEVYFFWVPLLACAVYIYCVRRIPTVTIA